MASPSDTTEAARTQAGVAFVASAVLPGLGQQMLGKRRWLGYAVLEVAAWAFALERRHRGNDLVREYRDLAWHAARRMRVGPRQDGDFEYYEALLHHASSGVYDADPARPGLQPERREATYNGNVWALARGLHLPAGEGSLTTGSAAHAAALAYYEEHAIPPELAWDWDGNSVARERYGGLVHESDDVLRSAAMAFGVVLANHMASALDALVTARLRSQGDGAASFRLNSWIEPERQGLRWTAAIRIAWPMR